MKNEKQNINIDASQLPTMRCPKCGNYTFHASFVVKKLSALVSPSGKETLVPIQVFTCTNCASLLPLNEKSFSDIIGDIQEEQKEEPATGLIS